MSVSAHIHLPGMFLYTGYLYEKTKQIGQVTSDLISICDLHTILRINSRGVPDLTTDSLVGVWGRG